MSDGTPLRCVLITPARNEAAFIEKTIQSVVSQTVLPIRWVIVNDGSTDGTARIIGRYAALHDWIEVVDMPERRDRSFAAKVHSFNAGYQKVKALSSDRGQPRCRHLVRQGFLLEFLLGRFKDDSGLGVAGTIFREEGGYSSATDSFEGQTHVSGQCQLFPS